VRELCYVLCSGCRVQVLRGDNRLCEFRMGFNKVNMLHTLLQCEMLLYAGTPAVFTI
jgi:hypothetical protein